eukprot:scaffold135672_cov72-Phaeocystis_antarctica.AAC.2
MAAPTSSASTGSLSNAAGDQSVAGEGGACLLTQTWMPERAPARTVEAPLPCASGQLVLREGQPSSGRKRSDRGATAVRVGHLVRAGPPRAARALVESRYHGGEEGERHG